MATREFVWPDPEQLVSLSIKAGDHGITLTPIPRFKSLYVARSSDGTKQYLVNETTCTCTAGRFGSLCKHRSLLIYQNMKRLIDQYGLPDWKIVEERVIAA